MYTIIETQKGKPCLIFNNYRYLCDRIRNTNAYWRCESRSECAGRLTQKAGQIPVLTAPHNHEPDVNAISHIRRLNFNDSIVIFAVLYYFFLN